MMGGLTLVMLLSGMFRPVQAADGSGQIARGRAVYRAEGCIHCHSQYLRHGTVDTERWGPAPSLEVALAGSPPLLGNRRQGPDLATAGRRRTVEWNRMHLIAPRVVSPGSRMPSYAHLFQRGGAESDGEALVAYLGSLGTGPDSAGRPAD
jgi:cbb3-type cytochrome c oxidase subunit II